MATRQLHVPAFVYDVNRARTKIRSIRAAVGARARLLYSVKACAAKGFLEEIADDVDGFSVSSIFELNVVREVTVTGQLHFISMGLTETESETIRTLVNNVTFNSLGQAVRFRGRLSDRYLGLRINPGCSIADDLRYDPCRKHTKLGVPLDKVARAWREGDLAGISGVHFHTACCTTSWEPLLRSVRVIEKQLTPMIHELRWINLGGGYQWDEFTDFGPLQEAVDVLTNTYGLQVFLEPGDGIVNFAGSLIASVLDLFDSDGKTVAILDTSVNHLPEVFEFQYEPDVAGHVEGAPHEYILAGCSCLAGDIFGEYAFEEPLDIGSRITFENVGAYSLVKANMFNGINLPSIYIQREDGELELVREFTYEDFLARCGGETHAAARA